MPDEIPPFDPTQPYGDAPATATVATAAASAPANSAGIPPFDPSQPFSDPPPSSDRGARVAAPAFDPSKPSVLVRAGEVTPAQLKWGLGTTFGLNPDGSVDTQDNGQGAPELGSHNTRDPNLVGVALPEDVLRKELGDDPAAWRKAKVQVTTPDGSKQITAPIVDLGPGAGPQSQNVVADLTYGAQQALGTGGKSPIGYRIIPDAQPDPLDNGVGVMHDLAARFIKAMDGAVLKGGAGLARLSAQIIPATQAAKDRANTLADALESANQDVDDYYQTNPAADFTTPAKVATAAGGVAGAVPAMAAGPLALPLLVSSGAGGAYEDNYQAALADGKSDEDARHAGVIGAVTTAPELAGYLVAGKLGALGAAKLLGPAATPLLRGIVGGATALPANMAASATIRGIEGQSPLPNAASMTTDGLFAVFHGYGEHASTPAQGAAGEELAQRGVDPQTGGPVSVVPHDAPPFDPNAPSQPLPGPQSVPPPLAPQPTAYESPFSGPTGRAPGAVPPPLSPEEAAEAEYQRELLGAASAHQAQGGPELLDAVSDAGGLPAKGSQHYSGEMEQIYDLARSSGNSRILRRTAPEPDELTTRLRDRGFAFETPDDLRNAVDQRLRTGKEQYGQPFQPDLAMASPQQATLPRQINAGVPAPAPGAPISESDIRNYLSRALDIPVRVGLNIDGKNAPRGFSVAGVFRPKPETIRTRLRNDLPTIAHEVGHYLHQLLFDKSNFFNGGTSSPYEYELRQLGKVTSAPNYTPDQVRKEGVAEFTREWLTDRAQALAKAPAFGQFFESELQSKYPQTYQILNNARDQVTRFINQPGWEKARSRVAFDQAPPKTPFRQWLQGQYTKWFNDLAPINRATKQLIEFGAPPQTAKLAGELATNYKGGWQSKADGDLLFDQTDLNGNRTGPSLKAILGKVSPKEAGDLSTYIALKRAAEKRGQGVLTGFESDLADADVKAKMAQLAPRFEPIRQKLLRYSDNLLEMMHQSGFFTPEQMQRMRSANKDYVPFYRIYEGVNGNGGSTKATAGFINTSSGVLRMKGSDRQIIDPLESIAKNTYMFRDLAERNRVGREFVKAVESTQGGGRVAESILKPMKPVSISSDEVIAKLKSLQIPEADELVSKDPDLSMTIFRAGNGISAQDGTFRVWDGGKERLFQSDDNDLLRALSLSDSADGQAMKSFQRWLAKPASWLRAGATHNPEFIARHFVRDNFISAVYSRHGFIPFFDGARGVLSAIRKDHWYQDWVKAGGKYSSLVEGGSNREVLQKMLAHDPASLQTALHLLDPRSWWHGVQSAATTLLAGSRVAEFRLAKAGGASDLEAANASKDLALNFAAGGSDAKALNRYITFLNTKFLDVDKLVRAHKEAPVRTALKGMLYVTLPSIALWMRGRDDPLIQNLPEWRRLIFWNMRVGDSVVSFPKPFLLGAIYGTLPEKALDYATKRDPNAPMKALRAIVLNLGVGDDITGLPTAFRPVAENIANYNFFTGRPVVNEAQSQLSPRLQFTPNTSETAKWLGNKLNYSPLMIDNAIQGYLGGTGRYASNATDWFLLKAQSQDTPPAPQKLPSQYPLLRGFSPSPYEEGQYVQRFYDGLGAAERRVADFNAYANRLDSAGARQFLQKNKNELAWYNSAATSDGASGQGTILSELRNGASYLADINKAITLVQESRSITPAEKTQRLLRLNNARSQVAEIYFKNYLHPTDRAKVF